MRLPYVRSSKKTGVVGGQLRKDRAVGDEGRRVGGATSRGPWGPRKGSGLRGERHVAVLRSCADALKEDSRRSLWVKGRTQDDSWIFVLRKCPCFYKSHIFGSQTFWVRVIL